MPDRPLFRGHFPFAVNRETGKRFLSRPGETGRTAGQGGMQVFHSGSVVARVRIIISGQSEQQFASGTGNRRSRPNVLISAVIRTSPFPSVKKVRGFQTEPLPNLTGWLHDPIPFSEKKPVLI